MSADAEFIVLDARIDMTQWNKSIAQMEADVKRIDKLISQPLTIKVNVDTADLRKAEGALADLDAGVTSEIRFDATGDDIAGLREDLDDTIQTKVNFTSVGEDIAGLRSKLDDTIDIKFTTSGTDISTIASDLSGIQDEPVDIKFTTSGEDIASIQGKLKGIEDPTIDVKMKEDSSVNTTLSNIESKLEGLQTIATIDLALNAVDFVKGLGDIPLVGALLEIEELSNRVAGQTGRDLENTGRIINNVWTGNWGDSKEEIADVLTVVSQMRDESDNFLVEAGNIEGVVTGAFQAASVGGEETLTVLRAASQLVKTGFATDFQDAFDFIALGFSQGLNSSDDFLDTIIEYSTTFEDAGLSIGGFFNIIKTATTTGTFNTDKMADAFKEFFNLSKEEIVNFNQDADDMTDRIKALGDIGQLDEATAFAAGEITGDEFAQGVIDAINEKFEDPAQQDRLAKAIFSPTMVEDAGLGNLLQADLMEANIWEGQAQSLSDEIFSGTGAAFQTMQRTLETHFLNALLNSVEAQEFMDKITVAAQRFGTELAAGADVGEALELALEIPGLADTLHKLESAFGNIAIVLLEVAASIGETFGLGVGELRADIAKFAAGQFVFDIQTAGTADELEARITSAINRGVSESDIADLTGQAVTERLEAGDIEGARILVDALSQVPDLSQVSGELGGLATSLLETSSVAETARLVGEQAVNILNTQEERQQFAAEEQLLLNVPTFDTAALQGQVSDYVLQLNRELQTAVSAGDLDLAKTIGDQLDIQNIDQFIREQEAQKVFEALYPTPTENDIAGYVNPLLAQLTNALIEGEFEEGAAVAQKLMNIDHPGVQSTVDDFATTLMVMFNNALGEGDVEEAQNILDILGLSPEANEVAFSSMSQRLDEFSTDAVYDVDLVSESFVNLGNESETTGEKGVESVDSLYSAVNSDKGQTSLARLGAMAKQFEAVADSIRDAIEAIDEGDETISGAGGDFKRVGGVGRAGVTTVGEGGRELVFSDERFAVLNNQTTNRLFSALSGMAGNTSNTNNTRNVNYSPTIIVQNEAQANLIGGQSLDQLRGEAF